LEPQDAKNVKKTIAAPVKYALLSFGIELGEQKGAEIAKRFRKTEKRNSRPGENRLSPREIGYAFHGVPISQGKYSTGQAG